jgi:glycosyltransferase involved in cell wall biosynthesis
LCGEIKRAIASRELQNVVTVIDTAHVVDFFGLFRSLLESHSLFVLPAVVAADGDDEGGPPVVITNAMAVGLPVISTPVGGITRAVVDGRTGFLCEPRDVTGLANTMYSVAVDPSSWTPIALEARRLVEQRFDRETQLKRLAELYGGVRSKNACG